MGSSPYGAFQPIEDLAEEAKSKFNDLTSGGPVKRMFQKKPTPAPDPNSGPKPTAKQLGWADPPKNDEDEKKPTSAGQRAMQKTPPPGKSGK